MTDVDVAGVAFDRRSVLGAACASLTTACVACPPFPTKAPIGAKKLGDAHTHLFNAADLPIRGFLNFVVIPEYLADIPEIALALIDVAVTVLKAMAPTAQAELKLQPKDATPAIFAERLASRIEEAARGAPTHVNALRPVNDVAHSYAVLDSLLRSADPTQPKVTEMKPSSIGRLNRAFVARIALLGRAAALSDPDLLPAVRRALGVQLDAATPNGSGNLDVLWDTIKWCYEMTVTRCKHVHDYLKTLTASDRSTELVINLLVDYDSWLGDSPTEGSSMRDQLLFWDRFSNTTADHLEIHTFAGYDPLKHAEDRLSGGGLSDYWNRLQGYTQAAPPARALTVGFKIYPPMGFKVFGNANLEPKDDRSGALVRDRWKAHRWPIERFGTELDASLDEFFGFCAVQRVPIIAHGRHSQEASTGTGEFASPHYWFERAQWVFAKIGKPLRACIAHWTNDSEFRLWAPQILEMNQRGDAEIYFDIAYSPDFLPDGNPGAFMTQLTDIYRPADQTGRWLLFGSDWIMLGREPGVERYAQTAVAAVRGSPFWAAREDFVLHDNLRRFLNRGP